MKIELFLILNTDLKSADRLSPIRGQKKREIRIQVTERCLKKTMNSVGKY